jgi:hypothetical protein
LIELLVTPPLAENRRVLDGVPRAPAAAGRPTAEPPFQLDVEAVELLGVTVLRDVVHVVLVDVAVGKADQVAGRHVGALIPEPAQLLPAARQARVRRQRDAVRVVVAGDRFRLSVTWKFP